MSLWNISLGYRTPTGGESWPLILQTLGVRISGIQSCNKLAPSCHPESKVASSIFQGSDMAGGRSQCFTGYFLAPDAPSRELPQRRRTLVFTLSWRWAMSPRVVDVAFGMLVLSVEA